ncbi:MAG: hypothetical protein AAF587_29990 [Bacteroidota bacterium]
MSTLPDVSPLYWATAILVSATIFAVFWFMDALTHEELVEVDLTDRELQTHRNILAVSLLMEGSLVLMYWWDVEVLPIFLALFLTRTAHEFIDELHYHTDRCSPRESRLHLIMWVSVIAKTFFMFMWGFFSNYEGIWDLPIAYYVWGVVVFGAMGWTTQAEWGRGKGKEAEARELING